MLVDITAVGFVPTQRKWNSCTPLLHIASISYQDKSGFKGKDPPCSHMPGYAFHCKTMNNGSLLIAQTLDFCKQTLQNRFGKHGTHQFMVLPSDRHAKVMHERSKQDTAGTVLQGTGLLFLQAGLDSLPGKDGKHNHRMQGNLPHMNRTMVIEAQSLDSDTVCIILNILYLLVSGK